MDKFELISSHLDLDEIDWVINKMLQYYPRGDHSQRWGKASTRVWDTLEKYDPDDPEIALQLAAEGVGKKKSHVSAHNDSGELVTVKHPRSRRSFKPFHVG